MMITIGHQVLLALQLPATVSLPSWLEGLWERDDIYVMSPDQDGDGLDGLTAETSWPTIVKYPRVARASASYPSPNGTKAYPNGVGVIVFLPGDYSQRKMHSVRPTEYWPHWDSPPSNALATSTANPLIIVYAEEFESYSGMSTHPTDRPSSIAQLPYMHVNAMAGVYWHGITSTPVSGSTTGADMSTAFEGKIDFCHIESVAAGATLRFATQGFEITRTFMERPYPWATSNDSPAVHTKDALFSTFTASSSSGLLLTTATDLPTGTEITVQTTGALPTGLAAATNYYVIRASSTTCRVATSRVNADAGTAVAYTDAGTGTHRFRARNTDNFIRTSTLLNYADCVQLAGRDPTLYRQNTLGVNITAPGTGYTVGDALVFGAGTTTTIHQAAAGTVATVNGGGGITGITMTNNGAYLGGFPSVSIVGTGSGATFTCTSLAGPDDGNCIFYGQNLANPNMYEQGWPQNNDYGDNAGTIIEDCWGGQTASRQIEDVYDTYFGIENCVDIKAGGTAAKPVISRRNHWFGLRTNGTTDGNGSPTACYTFHDTTSHVQISEDIVSDMSSAFNLNTQYEYDRRSDDTPTPAWESFTTVVVDGCTFSEVKNHATTATNTGKQGRLWYSGNSFTFTNNTLVLCPQLAELAKDAQAAAFVYGGNIAHTPFTSAPGSWTDGTVSSGYHEVTTVHAVPYSTHEITIKTMVPN